MSSLLSTLWYQYRRVRVPLWVVGVVLAQIIMFAVLLRTPTPAKHMRTIVKQHHTKDNKISHEISQHGAPLILPDIPIKHDVKPLKPIALLIVIFSDRSSYPLRDAVRHTWLQLYLNDPSWKSRVVHKFAIGQPSCLGGGGGGEGHDGDGEGEGVSSCTSDTLDQEKELAQEQQEFGDILRVHENEGAQGTDDAEAHHSRRGDSRMLCAVMDWAADMGDKFSFLMKTDDDVFVRLDLILKELEQGGQKTAWWKGFVWNNMERDDIPEMHAVSRHLFVPPHLPRHTSSELYLLSDDIVHALAYNHLLAYYPTDVLSLAMWLMPYNISVTHDRRFLVDETCADDMMARHGMAPDTMKGMYSNLQNMPDICAGFVTEKCPTCYPCRPDQSHWSFDGMECDAYGARPSRVEAGAVMDEATVAVLSYLPLITCPKGNLEDTQDPTNLLEGGIVSSGPSLSSKWQTYGDVIMERTDTLADHSTGKDQMAMRLTISSLTRTSSFAKQTVFFSPPRDGTLVISAWSRSVDALPTAAARRGDYALIVDIMYDNGEATYGVSLEYQDGTHDWAFNARVFKPLRPVSSVSVSAMLRHHQGTVWFDRVHLAPLGASLCRLKFQAALIDFGPPNAEWKEGGSSDELERDRLWAGPGDTKKKNKDRDQMASKMSLNTPAPEDTGPAPPSLTPPILRLVWMRPTDEFRLRHRRVLESIFTVQPQAKVLVYSDTLPSHFFHLFNTAGYNVHLVRWRYESLPFSAPGSAWLRSIPEHISQTYFHAHLETYHRLAILYQLGGVSSAFDTLLLSHPPPASQEEGVIVTSGPCGKDRAAQDACRTIRIATTSDKSVREEMQGVLTGVVVSSSPKHDLIRRALDMYDTHYDSASPDLATDFITRAYNSLTSEGTQDNMSIKVLPPYVVVPPTPEEIDNMFSSSSSSSKAPSSSLAMCLYEYKTASRHPEGGSVVADILDKVSLSNKPSVDTIY
eukprot:TRINITY_DN4078_c0_g1_i10.p1 TRINITY_DN4078_c0_g1~~TRINITY_DN4078_c0_g1_i10.p1  ORF type:complete len:1006 (+),score=219.28 TRINITY_DN4078_c0_g1_i10:103-3018(+)